MAGSAVEDPRRRPAAARDALCVCGKRIRQELCVEDLCGVGACVVEIR